MQITIDAHTKISRLLEVDRELVINTLIALNGKYARLKNPMLRELLAKRISIADACRIAHTPLNDFLNSMARIGFRVADSAPALAVSDPAMGFIEPRDYLELDVRPILAAGRDPLKEILAAVKQLKDAQGLKLINTFAPLPLIHLLAEKGFAYRVSQETPGLVVTLFNQKSAEGNLVPPVIEPEADAELFDLALAGFSAEKIDYIDVRDLAMPQPMLAILARTPGITVERPLFVYHKKIPVYLLPELEKQGLAYLIKRVGPVEVHLLIFRK